MAEAFNYIFKIVWARKLNYNKAQSQTARLCKAQTSKQSGR